MANTKKTVFIGLSGGVDSSVAAGILHDQGYNVVGVHLRCWNVDGCADQDAEDARRAAETLGIPFYVFDYEKEYKKQVVDYMVSEYRAGRTPNPDVMCNNQIKFGLFFDQAMKMGADYVATGHYARVQKKGKEYELLSGKDPDKDQSYFLWTLTQKQLAHILFPLGDLIKKTQVRNRAKKLNLPNATKKDSQGICFLGHVNLPQFLSGFIPPKKGKVLDIEGNVLGEHQGAHNFTIGQRKGLGIGGFKEPQYVVKKDIKKNTITLSSDSDIDGRAKKIWLTNVNFISTAAKKQASRAAGLAVMARIRYRQPLSKARLKKEGNRYLLIPDSPEAFVAIGQSAVFYSAKGQLLAGGIISKAR